MKDDEEAKLTNEIIEKLNQGKQDLEHSMSDLQKTVSTLKQHIVEQKEKQKLLVAFPDLNIPTEAQFESTGDIVVDMEKQLQANSIRISILEEENARLRKSLSKLKQTAQQGNLKLIPQTQLWSSPDEIPSEEGKKTICHYDTEETASLCSGYTRSPQPTASSASVAARSQRPNSMQWDKVPAVDAMRKALTNISSTPQNSGVSFYSELRRTGSSPGNRAFSAKIRKPYRK
ncbi:coiled-coil domain-containing protein 157-like [Protopterus annectens]|uniref:coiled-coil domain-containing protein 157-like n=1 Tax=Protopterus annectens TaxID=7888 RepID=UPI001CFBACAD|nr:coiled-coil domain-containing protein 157-like [Protopterus annectens]